MSRNIEDYFNYEDYGNPNYVGSHPQSDLNKAIRSGRYKDALDLCEWQKDFLDSDSLLFLKNKVIFLEENALDKENFTNLNEETNQRDNQELKSFELKQKVSETASSPSTIETGILNL